MRDETLKGRKMDAYVLLKILKYCTDSPARSYQMKFAIDRVFVNKSIDSTKDLGTALKKVIHYFTIRGKFSSVHHDLAAEGITRVEVGEEGLHFIRSNSAGQYMYIQACFHLWQFSGKDIFGEESLKEKEEDDEVLKLALETHSKREEEGLRSNHALACVNLFLFF